jgi:hypothetical protein
MVSDIGNETLATNELAYTSKKTKVKKHSMSVNSNPTASQKTSCFKIFLYLLLDISANS